MKKWAFAITVAFLAAVSVAAGAVALTDDNHADSGQRLARDAENRGESDGDGSVADCANPPCEDVGGGAAGTCIEGTIDCNDTPANQPPNGEVCIQIFPTPPECADPDAPVSNEPPATDPGGGTGSEPPSACTMEYPNECTATAAAVADLAARLDLKEDAITVVSVERVDWPDACLGVSQPGVACAEIITTGYRIILEANDQKYEYHTDGGARAVLVE
jgi:hypothetical protein